MGNLFSNVANNQTEDLQSEAALNTSSLKFDKTPKVGNNVITVDKGQPFSKTQEILNDLIPTNENLITLTDTVLNWIISTANKNKDITYPPELRYGNYGGPFWTGGEILGSVKVLPIDKLDEVFLEHDIRYGLAKDAADPITYRQEADKNLVASIGTLNEWLTKQSEKTKNYAKLANNIFSQLGKVKNIPIYDVTPTGKNLSIDELNKVVIDKKKQLLTEGIEPNPGPGDVPIVKKEEIQKNDEAQQSKKEGNLIPYDDWLADVSPRLSKKGYKPVPKKSEDASKFIQTELIRKGIPKKRVVEFFKTDYWFKIKEAYPELAKEIHEKKLNPGTAWVAVLLQSCSQFFNTKTSTPIEDEFTFTTEWYASVNKYFTGMTKITNNVYTQDNIWIQPAGSLIVLSRHLDAIVGQVSNDLSDFTAITAVAVHIIKVGFHNNVSYNLSPSQETLEFSKIAENVEFVGSKSSSLTFDNGFTGHANLLLRQRYLTAFSQKSPSVGTTAAIGLKLLLATIQWICNPQNSYDDTPFNDIKIGPQDGVANVSTFVFPYVDSEPAANIANNMQVIVLALSTYMKCIDGVMQWPVPNGGILLTEQTRVVPIRWGMSRSEVAALVHAHFAWPIFSWYRPCDQFRRGANNQVGRYHPSVHFMSVPGYYYDVTNNSNIVLVVCDRTAKNNTDGRSLWGTNMFIWNEDPANLGNGGLFYSVTNLLFLGTSLFGSRREMEDGWRWWLNWMATDEDIKTVFSVAAECVLYRETFCNYDFNGNNTHNYGDIYLTNGAVHDLDPLNPDVHYRFTHPPLAANWLPVDYARNLWRTTACILPTYSLTSINGGGGYSSLCIPSYNLTTMIVIMSGMMIVSDTHNINKEAPFTRGSIARYILYMSNVRAYVCDNVFQLLGVPISYFYTFNGIAWDYLNSIHGANVVDFCNKVMNFGMNPLNILVNKREFKGTPSINVPAFIIPRTDMMMARIRDTTTYVWGWDTNKPDHLSIRWGDRHPFFEGWQTKVSYGHQGILYFVGLRFMKVVLDNEDDDTLDTVSDALGALIQMVPIHADSGMVDTSSIARHDALSEHSWTVDITHPARPLRLSNTATNPPIIFSQIPCAISETTGEQRIILFGSRTGMNLTSIPTVFEKFLFSGDKVGIYNFSQPEPKKGVLKKQLFL